MAEPTVAEKVEQWRAVGAEFGTGAIEAWVKSDLTKTLVNGFADAVGTLLGITYVGMAPIGVGLAKAMANAEDTVAPAFSEFAAAGINDVFGTNVDGSAFARARGGGGSAGAGDALGRALMDQLKGASAELVPGDAAAAKYVNAMATIALEDWFKGWFFEVLSSLIPQLDIGKIENYGALGDKVVNVLGLGRITRRVLSPIVDASIVTPLRWQVEKTYRPTLLSASEAARQVTRGRWTRERGIEELARQGYSTERIEALLNAQRRFFSAADVRTFVNREHWTRDQGIQHLKDQGYEETAALDALRLEGLRRIEQLEDAQANAIIAAYVAGRIDKPTMTGLLADAVTVPAERALLTLLADTRAMLTGRRLSLSQVEAMVKSGVASVRDYREAARREGYPESDILLLELQLRYEIDRKTDLEAARREAEAERAADAERKAADAERRRAEVEAERAARGRGSEADLEAAAIRGLIPFARLEEVYRARYDADTVSILLELVEDRRLDYLEAQRRRDDAAQRAERRGVSVGQLEAAVLEGVLTSEEFRRHPALAELDAADRELLALTLEARLAARAATLEKRAQAERTARQRTIDLGRFEQLVRRGARTLPQYAALLEQLGIDEAGRAGMVELLQLQIAEDAAARAARDAAAAGRADRGLSLERAERAVLLGVMTIDDFQSGLVAQNFTTEAQRAIVASLRVRLDEAEAARQRRQATGGAPDAVALPLATVRRAARLGVISPDVYVARLRAAGYTEEDVTLDLELLLVEIADVQAARARREQADADADVRGLSLAQIERAVKRGLATVDAYRARLAELGYGPADAELLVVMLEDELAQLREARERRETIGGELAARELSLAQLEEAVKKGLSSVPAFYADVVNLGYGLDDAELLTALLVMELEAAPAGGGGA